MKQTPLYDKHVSLGAKLVDFAGYQMPIQYAGITQEHNAVRQSAGIFDVSHMGEFIISGEEAQTFLDYVTINDVASLKCWQTQYSAMCYEDGGLIDDLLIYHYPDHFMLVVNAFNLEKDLDWLMAHKTEKVDIMDMSDQTGLIALQGPNSREILQTISDIDLNTMEFYWFGVGNIDGFPATIARTGYTGELGFEIYADHENIVKIWDAIISSGGDAVEPTGLGCRNTLRIEMKYALYGNDIDASTNPIEAGLGWITKLDKENFIGKDALVFAKANLARRLICLEVIDRGIPRKGYPIACNGELVGAVTSGTQSPSLKHGIGLAYVDQPYAKIGTELEMVVRNKKLNCLVVKPPFYKEGTLNT
ncbi:MAG: glycine cleavage system aminomethyltransferase GcvT [Candidatus Marinimicrobia bacterium]|jgi:aminomethyltransferase|nr:glycine cleavage system aminomethyltransferase GcvT [Candidatus Neomarinimicrobiota bacterium]MDP6612028.1 glycine cleavage system aminomethyltransferase GcvT [Candidatus Neomarinimicrobiota bacterium]|tara:strand:- start:8614 stop:9699 length:1086 start_codon:yes stop_codon:yes gene_type:complete